MVSNKSSYTEKTTFGWVTLTTLVLAEFLITATIYISMARCRDGLQNHLCLVQFQRGMPQGVGKLVNPLGLELRERRFKSYRPDHMVNIVEKLPRWPVKPKTLEHSQLFTP